MAVSVLDYYRLKPEFVPPEFQMVGVYVRPNELPNCAADATHWELVGRTFHANHLQAADVERQGYCLRKLPMGIGAGSLYPARAA